MVEQSNRIIPKFPRPLAPVLRLMPLAPVSFTLGRIVRRLAVEHPRMFDRLGPHADQSFAIDPTDLPLTLLLEPRRESPRLTAHRRCPKADARIAGPLAALLGLVHGAYDGDALFFSRDLVIEGDTSAALALRNAIDDAELDLAAESLPLMGPLGRAVAPLLAPVERLTGVPLTRATGAA